MWKHTEIDLGKVRERSLKTITYRVIGDLPGRIIRIKTSCGCSKAKYDTKAKVLRVIYKSGNIPYHLRNKGFYITNKSVTVYYENGEKSVLKFKATVTK